MRWVSKALTASIGLFSLALFAWPLVIQVRNSEQSNFAQAVFMTLMPVLVVMLLVELSHGGLGTRQLAVLGVLITLNSAVRMLGAGTAGIETIFFLILIGAYVFGTNFGFLLGAGSILVSALLTGGVGPWLPFQMMAAGLLGLVAGALPKPKSLWLKLTVLSIFGVLGAYLYGALMTLWNWPFLAGMGGSLGYEPGAGIGANLMRFLQYEVVTGGLLWDTGRAVTTVVLTLLTAPTLLPALKRAAGRAGVEARVD
mgnify:CR=1 FL=1